MSHPDEHEAKAREWLYWRDKTKSTDIDSLVALLRSVAEQARREERAEWVEACENAREKGRREEAKAREIANELVSVAYRQAVHMHESIESGKGAVGWKDEHLLTVFANTIQRALDSVAEDARREEAEALEKWIVEQELVYKPWLNPVRAWLERRRGAKR